MRLFSLNRDMEAQISRNRGSRGIGKGRAQRPPRALESDPSEAKANIGLGQIMDWRGRHSESMGYLERAVVLNPSFAHASRRALTMLF